MLRTGTVAMAYGALALTLAGCELSRPEGAYTPTVSDLAASRPDAFRDGAVDTDGGLGSPASPPEGIPMVPADVPPDSPLGRMQGFYYLRQDTEFTYARSAGFATLRVFNRESLFALTQLVAEGDTLRAVERTCHFFYEQTCERGCTRFETSVAASSTERYRRSDTSRVYTLSPGPGQFETSAATLQLGWSGDGTALPSSPTDPSLWTDGMDGGARGFYVRVRAEGLPGPTQALDCEYSGVLRHVTAYRGALAPDGSLDGVRADLSKAGTDGKRFLAAGPGLCAPDAGPQPAPTRQTVRFVRISAPGDGFWTCPSRQAFAALLP